MSDSLFFSQIISDDVGVCVLEPQICPFKESEKHKMSSVTKSIASALIGIAVKEGFIKDVNQKVVGFFRTEGFKILMELRSR